MNSRTRIILVILVAVAGIATGVAIKQATKWGGGQTTSVVIEEAEAGSNTTNYSLYKPAVGETGWANSVNTNFDTIDTQMKANETAALVDNDTTYTATGTILELTGTVFGVKESTLTDDRYCKWSAANGIVCDTAGVGGTAYDDISDPDGDGTIDFTTYANNWTAASDGDFFKITNSGNGDGMVITQTGTLTGIYNAFEVNSSVAQTNNSLVQMKLPAGSTQSVLQLTNIGTADALYIGQSGVLASSSDHALEIQVTANSQVNGGGAAWFSQNGNLSTDEVLGLNHLGDGAHISFSGDPSVASPADGDMWFDGTALNFYDGTSTTDLIGATVTVTDDESTNDAHEIVFTTDNANLESDGTMTYNPSTGVITTTGFAGALTGNASTATALAANPSDCAANTFADAIDANGNLTCNGVVDADVANDITINSTAVVTSGVGFDAVGAVDLDYGSADVTDHTFTTDGTGDAEIVLPAQSIGTSEILNDTITHANMADADQADTKCLYMEDPVAADDLTSIWANKTANDFLITEIWAESDQTVAFDLQIDDGTPADVNGTDITPAAGEAEDTTLSGDTTLAAGEELDLVITSVTNTPTWVSICWTGNWVD